MARQLRGMGRAAVSLLVFVAASALGAGQAHAETVIVSTTTSTRDSGLLDVLLPRFQQRTGYAVKAIAVGTGQALALAARGEADVTLAHAPTLERQYLREGRMRNRRLVMYNDFVIVGPPDDPAGLAGVGDAAEAMRRIAHAQRRFVSRGDGSGTYRREMALWAAADVTPGGAWYAESGQGMGATLRIADQRRAYTLTDRATLLAFRARVALVVLGEGDPRLRNIYSVLEVNPANGPRVNVAGGRAFADFMVSPETQAIIQTFGVAEHGQPLFVPIAGIAEAEVGG